MKIKPVVHLSLLISLVGLNLVGTACGAAPTDANTAPSFTSTGGSSTPQLDAADERVRQAGAQLNVARKQLKAAQQLLKAAEADLRAARADREALAIKTQAQSLADEAGMTPSQAPPVGNAPRAIATAPAKKVEKTDAEGIAQPAPTQTQSDVGLTNSTPVATPASTEPSELKPTQNVDFNAEPATQDNNADAPPTAPNAGAPVMLR